MQKDKLMHFGACGVIAFAVMIFMYLINCTYVYASLAAIFTSTAAAWGKEYGDKCNVNNKWDWKDIIADTVGTIVGLALGSIPFLL